MNIDKTLQYDMHVIEKDGTVTKLRPEVQRTGEFFTGMYWADGQPIYGFHLKGDIPEITVATSVLLASFTYPIVLIGVLGNTMRTNGVTGVVNTDSNTGGTISNTADKKTIYGYFNTGLSGGTYDYVIYYTKEEA